MTERATPFDVGERVLVNSALAFATVTEVLAHNGRLSLCRVSLDGREFTRGHLELTEAPGLIQ